MASWEREVRLLAPAGASVAVSGGGVGRFLVHVFIWHLIWRAALALWRIPTFGPVIVVMLVIALVAAGCLSAPARNDIAGQGATAMAPDTVCAAKLSGRMRA